MFGLLKAFRCELIYDRIRECKGMVILALEGRRHAQVEDNKHGFLRDQSRADLRDRIGPDGGWCDFPRLRTLTVPSDVSGGPVTGIRPVLESIRRVIISTIILTIDVGQCGQSLLINSAFVGVEGSNR